MRQSDRHHNPGRRYPSGKLRFLQVRKPAPYYIPDGVTSIGDHAFSKCTNLTRVIIPDSVASIGEALFVECEALQIDISPDHPTLALIDNALIYKPENRLVAYLNGGVSEAYAIPQGILNIGDSAFYNCDSLTGITIPDSVTHIGHNAFSGCASLTDVIIPTSVTCIGPDAFWGCSSLTSVTIPDSVVDIGAFAFYGCASLSRLTIPASVTRIGSYAFDIYPNKIQLTVARDSYAKEYAEENHLSYTYADALDWLAP